MNPQSLLSVLIQLSKADRYFDAFEFTYLLKVGRHIGLSDPHVETLIKESKLSTLSVPADEEKRMTLIYHMLFLMKIDNKITSEERELVHHYGFKLGFSSDMIEEFIQVMIKHKDGKVPSNALLSIIKKYQN